MGNLSSAFERADTCAAYPYGAMNFIPELGIRGSKLPIAVRGGAESLKGPHRIGDGRNFSKDLHALFNKYLSNESNFRVSILLDSTFKGPYS
jgi:hypothetical protein